MTKIINLKEINEALKKIDVVQSIEEGFVAYSQGKVVVPPVGEMIFQDPPGDVHIKYGFIEGDDYYVVKIASGFPENINLDLPSSNGLMLLFSQKTGELACILLDEGHLTNVRTAAAGAVVAKYLAPQEVNRIGILGP
ncbi:MAG: ornithine cyclodeaminase family protein, partial [Candidatus Hodarchaeales archaeon]